MCWIEFRIFTTGCEAVTIRGFSSRRRWANISTCRPAWCMRVFNGNRNVREVELDRRLPLFWALDFNVDPMSSIVAQKSGEDVRVLDELALSRASTLEACEEFHARYANHQAGVVIYGDATGQRLQTAGTTDYQIIREFFRRTAYQNVRFRVPPSNPSVRERVALVNAKLFSASEEVHLFVHPRCRGLITDFEEVTVQAREQRDRQGAGSEADAFIGRAGLLDLAGIPARG